ncbi:MAG TPA: NAD-dependent epimerase/dehydratase family protein [Candidatus Dormibacteraeota bacterium]|nr:NAD-dependent epimerase/dehydratase family protein [Candidatus Dormibacteraeota bacterium]
MSRASGRHALVTGGAGFVGSHLVDRLLAEGWRVLVIDDLSNGRPGNVAGGVRVEAFDIAIADMDAAFRAWHARVVFHLAAQTSVPVSMQAPLRDLAVNVTGTHRVAAAARDAGAERLVFVSSAGAIYGETTRPATEATLPAPSSYYGVHKLAAEGQVTLCGLPYAIARPTNIYGPRQASGLEGAVVAAFVKQGLARQALTIDGDGRQTRDFVHVRDVVDALVRLGDTTGPVGTWNVASGRRTSIEDLAGVVERGVGVELGRVRRPTRLGDVRHSSASALRLRTLGWRPTVSLAGGIRELLHPLR